MRRPHSTLEALEPRIAPANVTAVFTNGLLVVTPTNAADSVVASVVQTSTDGFSVFDDGALVDTFTGVEAVRVLGSIRVDSITLDLLDTAADRFQGNVTLRPGDGRADSVEVLAGQMSGDLRVVLGREDRLSTADGVVVGGTLRMIGAAHSTVAVLTGSFGDVVASGLYEMEMSGVEVAGDLQIAGKEGVHGVVRLLRANEIAGDIIYRAGAGPDAFLDVFRSVVAGQIVLSGSSGGLSAVLEESFVGGGVTMALGAGSGGCGVIGSVVQGSVRVVGSGSAANVFFTEGSTVSGSVTVAISGEPGWAAVSVEETTIEGKVTVQTSQGWCKATATDGALLGGVTLRGTGGKTQFTSDAASVLAGDLDLTVTKGRGVCVIAEAGDLRNVRFRSGEQPDFLEIHGPGNAFLVVDATFGTGKDRVLFAVDDFSAVRLDGGAGTDTILEGGALVGPRVSLRSFELRE